MIWESKYTHDGTYPTPWCRERAFPLPVQFRDHKIWWDVYEVRCLGPVSTAPGSVREYERRHPEAGTFTWFENTMF